MIFRKLNAFSNYTIKVLLELLEGVGAVNSLAFWKANVVQLRDDRVVRQRTLNELTVLKESAR